tara:strand:- start:204 stop:323 length:120 start_codon:yes stop_codon:yes gene_type:complete
MLNLIISEITQLLTKTPEDEVVLYVDEVDIHLNRRVGRD